MMTLAINFPLFRAFRTAVIGVGLALATIAAPASAETEVNINDGYAVHGYDVVAYFTKGQPTKGSDEFQATYDGATYRFASAEHRDLFTADPAKYAPQYGGYCAFGTAMGRKFDGDPNAWRAARADPGTALVSRPSFPWLHELIVLDLPEVRLFVSQGHLQPQVCGARTWLVELDADDESHNGDIALCCVVVRMRDGVSATVSATGIDLHSAIEAASVRAREAVLRHLAQPWWIPSPTESLDRRGELPAREPLRAAG